MKTKEPPIEPDPAGAATAPKLSFWRRFFRWRTLGMLIFVVVALVTLALLVNAEENWRAARAWKECRRKLEARGERLDLSAYLPAPVPPEQNFVMIPLLSNALATGTTANPVNIYHDSSGAAALGAWRYGQRTDLDSWRKHFAKDPRYPKPPQPGTAAEDVLFALGKHEAAFAELRAGALRPYAEFPMNRTEDPFDWQLSRLALVKGLARPVSLRTVAFLAAGRSDEALADMRVNFKLMSALEKQPILVSFLVRFALVETVLQPTWEGLATHRWNEAQLAAIEAEFARLNFVADGVQMFRGERAFGNAMFDRLGSNARKRNRTASMTAGETGAEANWPFLFQLEFPCWVIWRSKVVSNECEQDFIDSLQRAANTPGACPLPNLALTNAWQKRLARTTPYNALARLLMPDLLKVPAQVCRAQTTVNLARVACALERYHLANGQYPGTLEQLAPRFLKSVPGDLYVGQPFHYRLKEDGTFLLYSVGANQADDGGRWFLKDTGSYDPDRGDLVWAYPAKP